MEERIKELTLLLLYLTSWEENELGHKYNRSWKGYPFETLNELRDEGYIDGSNRAKSVYISEEGVKFVQELEKKYFRNLET